MFFFTRRLRVGLPDFYLLYLFFSYLSITNGFTFTVRALIVVFCPRTGSPHDGDEGYHSIRQISIKRLMLGLLHDEGHS